MILVFLGLSGIACWYAFRNHLAPIHNIYIKSSLILFLSTYISVICIFLLACLLSMSTENVLHKAVHLYLAILLIWIILFYKNIHDDVGKVLRNIDVRFILRAVVFLTFFTAIYLFFTNLLTIKDTLVMVSPAYIDFHWHVRLIQNLTFGDNFPPQNESIAGIYHVYHYFWAVIPSIYQILGLNLAQAINLYSALFFSSIVFMGYGFMKEYGYARILFILLPLFILTHGSFKFIDHFMELASGTTFKGFFPDYNYFFDFARNSAFGYNGNMFNVFYFIQERQLIFACLGLLLYIYILLNIEHFKLRFIVFLGVLFGLFFQWHLYVSTMLIIIGTGYLLCSIVFIKRNVKHLLLFVAPTVLLLGISMLLAKLYTMTNVNFNHEVLQRYPQLNLSFSTMPPKYELSFFNFLAYYGYAYGLRIFIYVSAFIYAFKHHKNVFYILLSCLPVFILINTIQLSPLSVFDNHKWLKPFNLILDLFSIIFFIQLISTWKQPILRALRSWIVILAMLSGFISLLSFVVLKPTFQYANLKDPGYQILRTFPPRSVILTDAPLLVHMAGRKTYIADYLGGELGVNTTDRYAHLNNVKSLNTQEEICEYLKKQKLSNDIQYVYLSRDFEVFSCNNSL